MSMLTKQVENLRVMSEYMFERGNMSLGCQLREAADTIEDLRKLLTETCRNADAMAEAGEVWHSPRFVCSECGAVYVMSDYANFCPSCGRRVVE